MTHSRPLLVISSDLEYARSRVAPALERWRVADAAAERAKKDGALDRYALRSAAGAARRALLRWRRDVERFSAELAAVR